MGFHAWACIGVLTSIKAYVTKEVIVIMMTDTFPTPRYLCKKMNCKVTLKLHLIKEVYVCTDYGQC